MLLVCGALLFGIDLLVQFVSLDFLSVDLLFFLFAFDFVDFIVFGLEFLQQLVLLL